jgi:hypothetical protein
MQHEKPSLRGAKGVRKNARLSTGYGDEAIQGPQGAPRSLDCFVSLAMTVGDEDIMVIG